MFAEVGKKLIGAGGPKRAHGLFLEVIDRDEGVLQRRGGKVVYEHTEIEELRSEGAALELWKLPDPWAQDNIMFEVPIVQWKEASPLRGIVHRAFRS